LSARNVLRELQALGAHLERNGDRLILRAGSRRIPQVLVQRAREAKQDLFALLGSVDTGSSPSGVAGLPTSQRSVAVLGNTRPESRGNAADAPRPPVDGLSGGLREHPAALAVLPDDAMASKSEEIYGFGRDAPKTNLSASGADSLKPPITATLFEELAVLENHDVYGGSQGVASPKTATNFRRDGLSHAAPQQIATEARSYETNGSANIGALPLCCGCLLPIDERLETWWGSERCHRACGEAAWRREWRRRASSIHFNSEGQQH
jgi:hypothetical protein